jgi:hypothetical protein
MHGSLAGEKHVRAVSRLPRRFQLHTSVQLRARAGARQNRREKHDDDDLRCAGSSDFILQLILFRTAPVKLKNDSSCAFVLRVSKPNSTSLPSPASTTATACNTTITHGLTDGYS